MRTKIMKCQCYVGHLTKNEAIDQLHACVDTADANVPGGSVVNVEIGGQVGRKDFDRVVLLQQSKCCRETRDSGAQDIDLVGSFRRRRHCWCRKSFE